MISQFDVYKKELGKSKYDVITDRAVEYALLKRLQVNPDDMAAFNALVYANMRFVVFVLKEFSIPPTMEIMDIIQEGNIGLIEGIKRFKPIKYPKIKLFSYAVHWIRFFIHATLSKNKRYEARYVRLVSDDNKESDAPFIASLGSLVYNDEMLLETEAIAVTDLNDFLLKYLDAREAAVIRMYYGVGTDPKTLEAIGQQLHVKFVRVKQLRDRALDKLRKAKDDGELGVYF